MDQEELNSHGVSEHTGFPNAATDARLNTLDLAKLLVKHPSSTFYMRVDGDSGQEVGVNSNDIIVVDRAMTPRKSDLVVWWDNDSFVITISSKLPKELAPWGVITHCIHAYRGIDK